jgi:hypothetical protein
MKMEQAGQIIVNFPSKGKVNVTIKGRIDARQFNSMMREVQIEHRKFIIQLRKQREMELKEAERISSAKTAPAPVNINIPKPASEASLSAPSVRGGASPKGDATTAKPMREPEPEPTVPLSLGIYEPEAMGEELIEDTDANNKE